MDALSVRDWIAVPLLIIGVAFMFLGSVGLVRMPDVYTRMQAASKTATLGLWTTFLAVAVHFSEPIVVVRAFTLIILASVTVPVAAQAITRAAHRTGAPLWPRGAVDDLRAAKRRRAERGDDGE